MARTRVAILGTGRMGSTIARRLADSGIELTLWNRTRARAEEVGVGAVAATPVEAVAAADIVLSSLTGPEAVRTTYTAADGALAATAGQCFAEMSTAGSDVEIEIATRVAGTTTTFIDAPIVGTTSVVARGAALVLAGGAAADVERARPVLEQLGEVRHVGAVGDGARLKLVANSMLGAIMLAAAELQTAGVSAALDANQVFAILTRQVPGLELRRAGYVDDQHEPTMFAIRDQLKDLDLALEMFHKSGSAVPLTALVRELGDEVMRDAADLDVSAFVRRYRARKA